MVKLGRPQITNLVYTLDAAIRDLDAEDVLHSIDSAATRLRGGLRRMGCNFVQGYGIARPMPSGEVLGWTRHWRAQAESGKSGDMLNPVVARGEGR